MCRRKSKRKKKLRCRVNFYEAGSGQEVIRVDWFTLLFKVTRINQTVGQLLFVDSVNGATKLILQPRVLAGRRRAEHRGQSLTQVDARAFRHLNQFPNLLFNHFKRRWFATATECDAAASH